MSGRAAPADVTITSGPILLDASRFAEINRRRLSAPGLRTILAIADLWRSDEAQRLLVLGLPSRSTFYARVEAVREHRDVMLDVGVLLRISAALGIHQASGTLHGTEDSGVAWLRTPHGAPVFGGRPPLSLVCSGTQDGLLAVRLFLDAAPGGLHMPPNEVDRDIRPYTDADIVLP